MFELIYENKTLTEIQLHANQIGVLGTQALAQYLSAPWCRLRALNLNSNLLSPACGPLLASALSVNASLQTLDLGTNSLESSSATAMCQAMVDNPHCILSALTLCFNHLDEQCFPALLMLSRSSVPINFLHVFRGNSLSMDSAHAFIDQFPDNPNHSLWEVDLPRQLHVMDVYLAFGQQLKLNKLNWSNRTRSLYSMLESFVFNSIN